MIVKKECIDRIKNIINENHKGNMSEFSRASGINKSYISEFLKGKRGAGIIFIKKINLYCEKYKIKKVNFF